MQIIFNFCIGDANSFWFLHWQWNSFLFLALRMQIIFVFCIGNAILFYFLHWEGNLFFIFCMGNGNYFLFIMDNAVFLIICIAMQILFNFCIGNANYFNFFHCQCKCLSNASGANLTDLKLHYLQYHFNIKVCLSFCLFCVRPCV